MATAPLIINNFDTGIADSPHKGFGLMRNVDIEAYPGAVKATQAPITLFHSSYTSTFTANAGTDVCTATATVPDSRTAVYLTTTGTLPAGLSTGTVYFVIKASNTTFKLATTIANADAGTAIDITDTGSGTHTVTTVSPAGINHIVRDPRTGTRFLQDWKGRVWYDDSSGARVLLLHNSVLDTGANTFTNASGNGIVLFRNSNSSATYLLAFRNALIDIINVFGTTNLQTPSWTNGWNFGGVASDTTLNTAAGTGNRHHAIVGQDNIIYFTDARYIGTIKEISGQVFNPATTTTYSGNDQALDFPADEVAEHLEELGPTLLIAGLTYNRIYPWDRISDSFNLPILVPENGVRRLKNIGGTVYILAGVWGNIYSTQGSYVRHVKQIPRQVADNSNALAATPVTWGGIDSLNGSLLFGAGVQTSGNSGVYRLYPDGRLIIDRIPSTGSTNVTAIEAHTYYYYMGYSGGADFQDDAAYATFEGVIQSALYRVATKTEKATYSMLDVQIAKPAANGNIRIGYRTDTSSSFTTLATYAADGAATSFNTDIGLINIENIQIQAEIDGAVELVEIRLLP